MTLNKSYQDFKSCKSEDKYSKCKPKHSKPENILLQCGMLGDCKTFTSSDDIPLQLAKVTLDRTCSSKTEVLIKFSSSVKTEITDSGIVRLQYELFRTCDNGEPLSLEIWMFEENINFSESLEQTFSFVFCDLLNCSDCCHYFVIVTPLEITGGEVMVSKGRMAALSQSPFKSIKENHKVSNPKKAILTCGQGNGSIFFRASSGITPPAVNVANVSVDTSCLNKANVLFDFSSIITIGVGEDSRLQFEVFRVCGNGTPLSLGVWMFERLGSNDERTINFNFILCDFNVPSSCCAYFVKVTPIEQQFMFRDEGVIISNVRLTCISQSSCDCTDYNKHSILDKKSECIVLHPKPKEILLSCGSGNGMRTFRSDNDQGFQLAQVTLDTTSLHIPVVNVEFSSIVSIEGIVDTAFAQLRYELIRICDSKEPISVGMWSFDIYDSLNDNQTINKLTNIFGFTYCDRLICPSCCDYLVTVTPIEISEEVTKIVVSNARIAALAQEGICQ